MEEEIYKQELIYIFNSFRPLKESEIKNELKEIGYSNSLINGFMYELKKLDNLFINLNNIDLNLLNSEEIDKLEEEFIVKNMIRDYTKDFSLIPKNCNGIKIKSLENILLITSSVKKEKYDESLIVRELLKYNLSDDKIVSSIEWYRKNKLKEYGEDKYIINKEYLNKHEIMYRKVKTIIKREW